MSVRNLNIVSLLQHYTDSDYKVSFIKELAKTNYIYVPLQARSDNEYVEILGYLLDGKRKEIYYREIMHRFVDVRKRVLREYFGDEFADSEYLEQNKTKSEQTSE